MSNSQNQEQDGGGAIKVSVDEKLMGLLDSQLKLIQGLTNTQRNQAAINEQTLEIIQKLEARIEMLEQEL